MLAAIWSGAGQASDIFLLVAAILAGLAALTFFLPARPVDTTATTANRAASYPWGSILLAAALCLVALGLLAI